MRLPCQQLLPAAWRARRTDFFRHQICRINAAFPLHAERRIHAAVAQFCPAPEWRAFTLIELILVMAILTMSVSVTAPALSNFFRGRSLDSEARRLLALTHAGQSHAVSEGLPMDLWIDEANGAFGLEAEPSYETSDPHAVQFKLDTGLRIETMKQQVVTAAPVLSPGQTMPSVVSAPPAKLVRPTLPTIRFLPDGTISQSSPSKLHLTGRNGISLWLAQSNDKLSYEIRSTDR